MEQLQHGAEFVIVDHAGRMHSDSKARSDYEKMSDVANRLKDLAINLNIPMLVLWQLNRGVEKAQDKRPTLADLRDSGQAEEIADTVILLSRSNYYDKSIPLSNVMITADVAKARDGGQLGEVQFPWLQMISRPYIVAADEMGVEVDGIQF
jgi:replicative DNA helicase